MKGSSGSKVILGDIRPDERTMVLRELDRAKDRSHSRISTHPKTVKLLFQVRSILSILAFKD